MRFTKLLLTGALIIGNLSPGFTTTSAIAASCVDVKAVFARGSGGPLVGDANYEEWRNALETKLQTTSLSYEFINLDYTAVGVGMDHLDVSLGALVSGGEAYTFGASVNDGVAKLVQMVNNEPCRNTKFVIGGYSQGAMVVSKSLGSLNADRIIYAATYGDPKIYLPEGAGLFPDACQNKNLSDYRAYVPDCHVYKGLLGAYIPYQPLTLIGKLGVWCNGADVFCTNHWSLDDHLEYIADGLYEDSSRTIFAKICDTFGIANTITSPHDTAILIDSTGSMSSFIDDYKAEALRLATETLGNGGRVALYEYRDLDDPFAPIKHCDFATCDLATFAAELASITTDGGGDTPESLLSASFHAMQELNWRYGATKSLIVLTDADFLLPDRDGVTFDQVVKLSREIDPVNFYIITTPDNAAAYQDLATATDGQVITNPSDFSLLTDYIMSRYDSLPRVLPEENCDAKCTKPTLAITGYTTTDTTATLNYDTNGSTILIALNDAILGTTTTTHLTLTDLDRTIDNTITLVPFGDNLRGDPVTLTIPHLETTIIPKTPNTGFARQ